jgi:hypothetical protein
MSRERMENDGWVSQIRRKMVKKIDGTNEDMGIHK